MTCTALPGQIYRSRRWQPTGRPAADPAVRAAVERLTPEQRDDWHERVSIMQADGVPDAERGALACVTP